MKPCFHESNFFKQPAQLTIKKRNISFNVQSLYTLTLFILVGTVAISWGLEDINAQVPQSGSTFKVIVEVANNGNLDEQGTIHVAMDGSRDPQVINNLIFPAFQSTPYTFEFSSSEAPVGKGFTAEVIYGDDEHKRAYGTNTSTNSPEAVSIDIP